MGTQRDGGNNLSINQDGTDDDGDGVGNVDSNGDGDVLAASQPDVPPVVNTVLTFVCYGLNTGTSVNVKKIASETFSLEEIKRAHQLMFQLCDGVIDVTKHGRRLKETCMADIVTWMMEMEKIDKVPYFVVDVAGIALLPKFNVEDLSEVAMCTKLRRLEAHLSMLDESVAQHTIDISEIKQKRQPCSTHAFQTPTPPQSSSASFPPKSDAPDPVAASHDCHDRGPDRAQGGGSVRIRDDTSSSNAQSHVIPHTGDGDKTEGAQIDGGHASNVGGGAPVSPHSATTARGSDVTRDSNISDGTKNRCTVDQKHSRNQPQEKHSGDGRMSMRDALLVNKENEWKTKKGKERKKNGPSIIFGKSTNSVIKSSFKKNTHIYIGDVHSSVSSADIADYLTGAGIRVIKLVCLTSVSAPSKSFKLSVSPEHFEAAKDPELYDKGINVREWEVLY